MNNNEIRNQARRQRIQRLSQNIKDLTETLNRLIIEDSTSRETPIRAQQHSRIHQASSEEFEIHDRVEILNNYLGLKGARGVVTQVTAKQVCIRLDGERRVYTKFKKSVRKLRDNEDS